MYNDKEKEMHHKSIMCPVQINEDISISVPVEICAHADVDQIELECLGHHIEHHMEHHVEYDDKRHKCKKFKIVQKVHVKIPVKYYVECDVRDEHVDFDKIES